MRASAARRTILPVSVRGSSSQTTMRSGVFEPRRLDRTCWRSCSGSAVAIAKHDGGLDALPPFLVRNADDDRVGDVGVAQEHVLDLGRRNVSPPRMMVSSARPAMKRNLTKNAPGWLATSCASC